jgi:hypothetical protein
MFGSVTGTTDRENLNVSQPYIVRAVEFEKAAI